jgi:hypothetical protein
VVTDFDDPARLRVLAGWLEAFERPDFSVGEWGGGQPDAQGVIQMPYVERSDEAQRFVTEAASAGWIFPFDWPTWAATPEARALLGDPARVAAASADDLARLLTTIVRGDRFSEGTLVHAHESGLLTAITRRAATLLEARGGS